MMSFSDANDDDSWEKSDKSVANELDATDSARSVATGEGNSCPSPSEIFNKKIVEPKANDDDDW